MNNGLHLYKQIMVEVYPEYQLIYSDEYSLSFRNDVPAKSPNLGAVGCLILLGVIPGIIYYLLFKQNAKVHTVNVNYDTQLNQINISGTSPFINKIVDTYKSKSPSTPTVIDKNIITNEEKYILIGKTQIKQDTLAIILVAIFIIGSVIYMILT